MRRLITIATLAFAHSLRADSVALTDGGRALLPVVIQDEPLRPMAEELAVMLERITGARFEIQSSGEPRGLFLGLTPGDVPPTEREDYTMRSEKDRLVIVGRTSAAVEHAVWDLLHRCGFRQFFPGKKWEIVPRTPTLSVDVDVKESPDYHARRIWAGFGVLKEREAVCAEWNRRNRATSGIQLSSGHAYDGMLHRNEKEFAAHPEYLALVNGERRKPKFCIANNGLRKLVIADALAQFAAKPELDSISCDPSDGGGWCECAECAKIGSVTDRALLLANEVAEAVNKAHPGRIIGMYAYNEHSPPPSIEAHPQVVISVATGFIRGGYTIDQLLAGWNAKARTLGIREYYSVSTWDRDLPGASRGSNIGYLRTTIPHFHSQGARYMSAEASDNAGPNGLGCYLAARMLWDVKEADQIEALVDDFFDKSFGAAREPMWEFYTLLDGTKKSALSDDLIGRMWRQLDAARALTKDGATLARLDDLALYTHYCGLYLDYSSAAGKERQAAFEALFRFLWRTRHTGMVHTKALWRDIPNRDKTVQLPPLARYSDPDATNPWKSDELFTRDQITAMVRDGIERRKLLDFEPVSFSMNLVPASKLKLPTMPRGNAGLYLRGVRDFWTWTDKEPATLTLGGTAGIIYQNRGTAKLELYPLAEAESKSVAHLEIEPDKQKHELKLETKFPGLHRLEVSDSGQGTLITWPDSTPMTVVSSTEQPAKLHGRWHLYFYVPKGTAVIGGFAEGEGFLLDPAGKTAHTFAAKPGYFSVKVPAGQDGQLWSFKHSGGNRLLMTVPPCLARDASELLLPEEVVEKDVP
ncbi:MAG: DUF4838 domain-containing protein [Verrucomicrobiaceae bacterium]|nr:DUF4838 domain-containing protein [Verrucomicrobiaceae bacterium]